VVSNPAPHVCVGVVLELLETGWSFMFFVEHCSRDSAFVWMRSDTCYSVVLGAVDPRSGSHVFCIVLGDLRVLLDAGGFVRLASENYSFARIEGVDCEVIG
jgi:hypothetical protein